MKPAFFIKALFAIILLNAFYNRSQAQNVTYPQFEYVNYSKTFTYTVTFPSSFNAANSAQADAVTELNNQGKTGWELISYSLGTPTNGGLQANRTFTWTVPCTFFLKRKTGIENINAHIDSVAQNYINAAVAKIQTDLIATLDTTINSTLKAQVIQAIKTDVTNSVQLNFQKAVSELEDKINALAQKHR